jgi:hypothetical protein
VIAGPDECGCLTEEYRTDRDNEALPGDLVIGYFRGDSELVILPDGSDHRSKEVVIVLPIDPRPEWPVAAPSLAHFLARFAATGEKWWPS